MKKNLSIVLAVVLALSVAVLIFLDSTKEENKFGMGVTASYGNVASATAEEDGSAQLVVNIASVLVDKDGRIIKCALDCADSTANFKTDGTAVESVEHKTKYEKGDDYNMVAYGGAKLEWYQQADAFEKVCEGKTIDEVKALVADGKAGDEVIAAGCTIYAGDFVKSLEEAVKNAKDTDATSQAVLKIGVVTSQTNTDYSEEVNGSVGLATTVVSTVMEEDKVISAATDVVDVKVEFDDKGAVLTNTSVEIKTKYQLGDSYNMVAYGGAKLEWYQQADAFSGTLIGKNSEEIANLAGADGKGTPEVQTAGCTIYVTDFVKAAVKATV